MRSDLCDRGGVHVGVHLAAAAAVHAHADEQRRQTHAAARGDGDHLLRIVLARYLLARQLRVGYLDSKQS
jgi:hypothetical protein